MVFRANHILNFFIEYPIGQCMHVNKLVKLVIHVLGKKMLEDTILLNTTVSNFKKNALLIQIFVENVIM